MFGLGAKKVEQPPVTKNETKYTSANMTETYNNQMGKTTDKAVDTLYAN